MMADQDKPFKECPECGSPLRRPKKRVQFDNSMTCDKGHKFDVFVVAGSLTIEGYLHGNEWTLDHSPLSTTIGD